MSEECGVWDIWMGRYGEKGVREGGTSGEGGNFRGGKEEEGG